MPVTNRGARVAAAWSIACTLLATACGGPAYECRDCNVVLISLDTLRADHVGAYGYARPTTPNIDGLAERGVIFEDAISQSSWTRPAHMSMLTGLHPSEHGFIGLSDRGPLDESTPTLAGELAERGYRTVAFTGGVNVSRAFGFAHGFGEFRSNGKFFRDNLEETRYWLDQHGNEKFFLFWHGYDAHTPYANDPADRAALELSTLRPRTPMRRACKHEDRRRAIGRVVDEYDASVRRGDRFVGKLLRELEARGLMHNTVVVFTSDHGEEFLDHGACFHISTLYREVLHVPLIVVAPGLAPRRVPSLVPASVSIGASILDLAGIRDHDLPGPSLVELLTGGELDVGAVVSETRRRPLKGRGHVRSLTTAKEKLIHWVTEERYELFDVQRDSAERFPRTDDAGVRRLAGMLTELTGKQVAKAAAPKAGGEQGDVEQQLKALGYIE